MATLSYDGQSFSIDGRRVWLVSGAIHYARVPRDLWRDRIRAAKQAGLNCIETYVFWNVHESSPGKFDWEGQNDLRAFVQTVGEEGMLCIVRPGPYICAEWDFGGMPAWLHTIEDMVVRESSGPFLEACSRYLTAVLAQVRDLQITTTAGKLPRDGRGPIAAPIIMMQAENEWICHNPIAASEGIKKVQGYLREIVRYLRENGCDVPINVCNNLWQRVEGAIDTWNANQHLATDLRQLKVVQPEAPRIVTEFWPGWFDQWGGDHHTAHTPPWNSYRLAQILASGAMYNLFMFHGGTNFGFFGGRSVASPDCFMTTSYDYDAPLREAGGRGEKFAAIKRISMFASQFGHVFGYLNTDKPHTAITPDDADHPLSVIHQPGEQGDVVFFFRSENDKTASASLLLANGLTLPVALGESRVAWLLLNARLPNNVELTYTNLRPWAMIGQRMLVLFGPAGSHGIVAIDGAQMDITVPTGKSPTVQAYEDMQIVVLNEQQVDAAYAMPDGLVVGADGLDADDKPLPLEGWPSAMVVNMDGHVTRRSMTAAKAPTAPRLSGWKQARLLSWLGGSDEHYQPIDGPASLEALRCDYGYGFYRLQHKAAASGKHVLPRGGDRLHVYNGGKLDAILGLGPSAQYDPTDLKLGKDTVVLADNLGRFNFGWNVGRDVKGLADHLYTVSPVKLGKPTARDDAGPNPFDVQQCVLYQRVDDQPRSRWYDWSLSLRGEKTLMLDIQGLAAGAVVYVNEQPVGLYHPTQTAGVARFRLGPGEPLTGGKNTISIGLIAHDGEGVDIGKCVKLYELPKATTAGAAWAFAPLTMPEADAFGSVVKSAGMQPCFFRGTFKVSHTDQPLWLEPVGMSKGQIYLNGHNVGRYFVGTHTGKTVGPQARYYLPEPWLKTDGDNELTLFDEHGKSPSKCKLVYDRMGPYGE